MTRSQRLAAHVRRLVRAALSDALASLPDRPHPAHAQATRERVASALRPLGPQLARTASLGLGEIALWGHERTAALLTARVRGRLKVKPVREDFSDYARWVIDPPSMEFLRRVVGPAPERLTRLADPQAVADAVWQGIAAGHDRPQIEATLADLFDGLESAARRVVRTEGMRVATETQLAASEELGPDLVVGYQVLSVLDERVRPEHRERHGRVYYRNPKKGQYGFDTMPRPPIDMPGRVVAHNCRCVLVPVFDLDDVEFDPLPKRGAR